MLRVFWGGLALGGDRAGNAISLLVFEIELGKFALQNSNPTVHHDLLVVQGDHLLGALEGSSSTLEATAWATLEELLGCGPGLEFRFGWDRIRINL